MNMWFSWSKQLHRFMCYRFYKVKFSSVWRDLNGDEVFVVENELNHPKRDPAKLTHNFLKANVCLTLSCDGNITLKLNYFVYMSHCWSITYSLWTPFIPISFGWTSTTIRCYTKRIPAVLLWLNIYQKSYNKIRILCVLSMHKQCITCTNFKNKIFYGIPRLIRCVVEKYWSVTYVRQSTVVAFGTFFK